MQYLVRTVPLAYQEEVLELADEEKGIKIRFYISFPYNTVF